MKQRESNKQAAAPWRVIITAWVVLLALTLVFAKDIRQRAQACEPGTLPAISIRLATNAEGLARTARIILVRDAVQDAVQGFYDAPVMLAGAEHMPALGSEQVEHVETASAVATSDPIEGDGVAAGDDTGGLPRPTRVLLVGDSSIQEGLGAELERLLEQYQGITVRRFGKYSSGLARPDYFNWGEKICELKAEFQPDLIIAHWGDNDCQGLSTEAGEFIYHFGTDEWDALYGERTADIIALMHEGGAGAVIVGLPIMRSKSFSRKVARLNTVSEDAVAAAGGVYIPTWGLTANADGKYMSRVEFNGANRIIRAGDGIHLSTHGSAYVADGIITALREHFMLVPLDASGR